MALVGSALVSAAFSAVLALETLNGLPIAILERTGDDPSVFWMRTAEILCEKVGDGICVEDLTFLTANNNPLGYSLVLDYTTEEGEEKSVCALLPPIQGLSPSVMATGLTAGGFVYHTHLPESYEAESWLILMHAANCFIEDDRPTKHEEKRSDAFASLTLTLLQGDTSFTTGNDVSQSRYFSYMRNQSSSKWAVSVGERILFDLWKQEARGVLASQYRCNVSVAASSTLDTEAIPRARELGDGRCDQMEGAIGYPSNRGKVTDGNLHLWMFGEQQGNLSFYNVRRFGGIGTGSPYVGGQTREQPTPFPGIGAPPLPWTPMKPFASMLEGVEYAWSTSEEIARQR